ncbi:MAG: polysaccharide deacetylase family protein [Thermodesulfovibrionaceae bacterium]
MFNDSIPVVMYHHVMPEIKELNVPPQIFEEQILALKRAGWKTLNSEEFLYLIKNPKESRKKCVLLTFDDGFLDSYFYAYPILKKHKMKAVLFVATEFITDLDVKRDRFKIISHEEMRRIIYTEGKQEVMCSWSELREMEAEGVFNIESHGHSHKTLYFIKAKDYESLKRDLELSKILIHKYLNRIPQHLAWPKGVYDEVSIKIANSLGFVALYTTERGSNTGDLNRIKRLPVKCKGSDWLLPKLKIYSSSFLSKIYLKIRKQW